MLILVGVLALATLLGVLYRVRDGKLRTGSQDTVTAADFGLTEPFTTDITLVQFSTETCSRCPSVKRLLTSISDGNADVSHVDVDLTHRPDIAARFHVLQTPTTLILDSAGVIRTRIGGVPQRAAIEADIDTILENSHV